MLFARGCTEAEGGDRREPRSPAAFAGFRLSSRLLPAEFEAVASAWVPRTVYDEGSMTKKFDAMPEIARLLAQHGFRKRKEDIFTLDATEDVLGWLGLNRSTKHRPAGEVAMDPVIGVRHQGVERVLSELRGDAFHPYIPPTISMPLGYLLPEHRFRQWNFQGAGRVNAVRDLVAAVATYGLPLMRKMTALAALCEGMEGRLGFSHQLNYRRPVAVMLSGDSTRASRILEESVAKLGDRSDPAAQEFRRFAEALRRRLAASIRGD
jgi:hypothetical protein